MKMLTREGRRIGSTPWFVWTMAMLLSLSRPGLTADENQPPLPNRSEAAAENPVAAAIPAAQPEVWLCAGDRIADLLRPDAEWPFVKQHLTGIKLYVGQLTSSRRQAAEATSDQLRQLVRLARAHKFQVAVELGGCLDFSPLDDTAGEWSARHELASLANWYAAGGKVDFLDIDGPIRRLMHPENRSDGRRFDSIDKAADELVSVDWLGRVRAYEDFARQQGLTFNLIVNSERGGQQSDDLFCRETLQMVDAYLKSGGRPTRWFVQSWYPYPKQMTPETAPHTMTALVKAAIERVSDGAAPATRREAPARPAAARGAETLPQTHASTGTAQGRIVLQPQAGAMQVRAQVPRLDNQAFALGIDNLDRCCLHAAPNFGDIGPGEGSTTVSRSYLAKGTRDDFLQRLAADRPGLSARQKWARPVGAAHGSKPARADGGDSQGASGHGPSVGSGSAESGRIITKLRVSETTSLATQREASDEHTPIPGSARSVTIHGGARIERKRRQVAALQNAAVGQREPASHVAVRQTGTLGRRKRLVGLLKASNTVAQGGAAYPGLT